LSPEDYGWIVQNFTDDGCRRAHFTGGEPLMLPQDYLLHMIREISSVKNLDSFWITTNGYKLYERKFCKELADNGLRLLYVSIGASDNESYRAYTGSRSINLDMTINGINNAVLSGIKVKISIPVFKSGINSYGQLMSLIKRLDDVGAESIGYFNLYKGDKNHSQFDSEYYDSENITSEFGNDPIWSYFETKTGQRLFISNRFKCKVIIPDITADIKSSCSRYNCGNECQGIYQSI
jgi:molybdenum cofactor biosynthesis enzyme MoaA